MAHENDDLSTDGSTRAWSIAAAAAAGASLIVVTALAVVGPSPRSPQTVDDDQAASAAEQRSLDAAPTDPAAAALAAQAQVEQLELQLEEALFRARAAEDGADANPELAAEVARLDRALRKAKGERNAAREDLAQALANLDAQIGLTVEAERQRDTWRSASTDNLWAAFVQSAKVDLCDRGTRKAMARCQESVATALGGESRTQFDLCVTRQQTVPVLTQIKDGDGVPANSKPFPDGSRLGRKDWYVQYCDPTLPEAMLADASPIDPAIMVVATH